MLSYYAVSRRKLQGLAMEQPEQLHPIKSIYRKIQPWLNWFLGASFFFSEYFARVDPSAMVTQLMAAFSIGGEALGNLSGFFYYPYLIMQIPVGALVDRYGPRRLLMAAALLCALACYFFANAQHLWMAQVARVCIGFTAAFAFVGTLKLATIWFDSRHLGLLAGLTQGMGMFGAAVGVGVFPAVVDHLGWRFSMSFIGSILLVIFILIAIFVRDRRPGLMGVNVRQRNVDVVGIFDGLVIVLRNMDSWINAIYASMLYAATGTFAELWGRQYFVRVYHMSPVQGGLAISAIFIGAGIGGPLLGWISDFIGKRKPVLFCSALFSLILMTVIFYVPLSVPLLFALLLLYGVCNMGVALAYAVAGELNPRPVAGVSIAFTNMWSVLLVPALQPLVGWFLQRDWSHRMVDGAPFYSAQNYHHAVPLLLIGLLAATLISLLVKETYCQGK